MFIDPNETITKRLGCVLNGQDTGTPVIKLKLAISKRKKRDVDPLDSGKNKTVKHSDGIKAFKSTVYGCQYNYERLTSNGIDICLRIAKDKDTKKEVMMEFDTAKEYCKKDKAKLLYFLDSNEALEIWNWLGTIDEYLIILFQIIIYYITIT